MTTKKDLNYKNLINLSFDEFIVKTKGLSYMDKAILWFQVNLNEKITSSQLARIPGKSGQPISHNMRRIFELRDEKGYNIVNWKDNDYTKLELKVNEWMLLSLNPIKENIRSRGVNKRIAFEVFSRDNYTCKICGRTSHDDDPFKPNHKVKLHVGHIKAHKSDHKGDNSKLTPDNFITMCNVCNEGAKNNNIKVVTLLDKVKNASNDEQKSIFEYLKNTFDTK